MLNNLHFSYIQYTAVVLAPMLVKILTMTYWGKNSERFGNKTIMFVSAFWIALTPFWWFIAGFFQGYFTFAIAYAGLSDLGWDVLIRPHVLIPGLLTSLMLWGNYPLTQVYQHGEDSRRGDRTLSLVLGIKGTFFFSSILFGITGLAFAWYFFDRNQTEMLWVYLGAMAPIVVYFFIWFGFVKTNPEKYASYSWAMGMNSISALALNAFFIYYFLENTQILQVFGY
jgi:1,4-dihydroxy-2-naphthoate octaprenyltransferase